MKCRVGFKVSGSVVPFDAGALPIEDITKGSDSRLVDSFGTSSRRERFRELTNLVNFQESSDFDRRHHDAPSGLFQSKAFSN